MRPSRSIVFPVGIDLPARITIAGRDWFRRPELHVTTFTPDDLAEAVGLPEGVIVEAAARFADELSCPRTVVFDGRVARVDREDGRRTIVAFCALVPPLDGVYGELSAAVGRPLPPPPTHITLFTADEGRKGIGLATTAQVDAYATFLEGADLAMVVAALERSAATE